MQNLLTVAMYIYEYTDIVSVYFICGIKDRIFVPVHGVCFLMQIMQTLTEGILVTRAESCAHVHTVVYIYMHT